MHILAIIPARGGSKGVPKKNIVPIAGKPLIAYTIEQAQNTKSITRIVVSTDDELIANTSRQYGAEVIERPADIATDTATSESALVHVLDYLQTNEGYEPDLVVFLQATSPLRRPNEIQSAIDTFFEQDADSLFSAVPVHGFVWRKYPSRLESITYDYHARPRRQDIGGDDLLENGSIYVFKPYIIRKYNNRLGDNIAVHIMDPLASFQIDEPHDLTVIESLLKIRYSSSPQD